MAMSGMMTAKEVQEMLQVDRSTIYRMAESGRLPAIKVGKQWRFPAEQVESWMQIQIDAAPTAVTRTSRPQRNGQSDGLVSLIPVECVQLIQDSFADLLGTMLVVTDLDGNPITQPSHSCGLFDSISQEPHAVQKCIESWSLLGAALDLEPRFNRSHLGLLCARSMIRVGAELKGMVIAGCLAPDEWPPTTAEVEAMAIELDVQPELLTPHLQQVYFLNHAQRQSVLVYLKRIANIVAHIVNERKSLVERLEAIADLTEF
jgi:excisionase family DNA binding protein